LCQSWRQQPALFAFLNLATQLEARSQQLFSMLSVLVVEDHQAVRDALVAAFLGWGYSVAAAATMPEATAVLEKRSFALIVTDVDLGAANGLDLVRSLGTRQPQVAFIVMSGRVGPKEVFANGIEEVARIKYLRKPFLLSQLQAVLAELFEQGATAN